MSGTKSANDALTEARKRKRSINQDLAAQKKRLGHQQQIDATPESIARTEETIDRLEGDLAVAKGDEARALRALSDGATTLPGVGADEQTGTLLSDPRVREQLQHFASSKVQFGVRDLGIVKGKEALIAESERNLRMAQDGSVTYDGAGRTAYPPITVQELRQRLNVLNLIPQTPMENRTQPFIRESGSFDTALETAEGAIKPEAEIVLEDDTAVAKTVAHFFKSPKQLLSDFAGLGALLNSRLTYGVMRRLERQVLAGDGTGENLLGILNTTNLPSIAYSADALMADQILQAITTVLVNDANPGAIVVNPVDWASMLTVKAETSGVYLSSGPFSAQATTLWGLPVIASKSMSVGKALVGDFTGGCVLLVREGVNAVISDADVDDFERNMVTILAEGRFGFFVSQIDAFCEVDLAAPES